MESSPGSAGSSLGESLFGYAAVPFLLVHGALGFTLIPATMFGGYQDFTGEQLGPLIGFPIFVVALGIWIGAGLCLASWMATGHAWFLADRESGLPRTWLGILFRFISGLGLWVTVLLLFAIVPTARGILIRPLALAGASGIPVYERFLDDSSPKVRRAALDSLGLIGAPARESAPKIIAYWTTPTSKCGSRRRPRCAV